MIIKLFNVKFFFILALSILGLIISLYATWDWYQLHKSLLYHPLICNFLSFTKCINVNASKFSAIGGIPIAWFAFLYYWWMSLSLIIKSNYNKTEFHIILLILTFISFCISIFLILLQIKLKIFCIYCLAIITINIISFIVSYLNFKRKEVIINKKVIGKYFFSGFLLLIIGIIFYMVFTFYQSENKSNINHYKVKDSIDVKSITKKYFTTQKPVKITVIMDYFCPYCRYLSLHLENLIVDNKDKIEIAYINYPLNSTIAARAAILAKRYHEFQYFHNQMFINQEKVDSIFIINLAGKKNIDINAFSQKLYSSEVLSELAENINTTNELKFNGLPALFINNHAVEDCNSSEQIKFFINFELNNYKLKSKLYENN